MPASAVVEASFTVVPISVLLDDLAELSREIAETGDFDCSQCRLERAYDEEHPDGE